MTGRDEGVQLRSQAEEDIAAYFEDLVSEWNPCFSSDGRCRFFWDEEVGAHDVELLEPERVQLDSDVCSTIWGARGILRRSAERRRRSRSCPHGDPNI